MDEVPNKRQAQKAPKRSQGALWVVIVGLVIVLYSSGVKDEGIGDVVFWVGVACSVVGILYWGFRPKHGLP